MRLSVITPSLNQGRFIGRTVESVLSQDMAGLEYIVVDGGSTDETVDVLRSYGSQLRWISERDCGQGDAVNKGILQTSGDIIGWINSDDVYCKGALSAVMDYMDAHPEVDVLYGDANHIDERDEVIGQYPTEPWDIESFKDRCIICQPAAFFRRQVTNTAGLLDVDLYYSLDYEYWLRLALAGMRFDYLPMRLARSRLYAETKTARGGLAATAETIRMFRRRLGAVPDRWLLHYAYQFVDAAGLRREHGVRYGVALWGAALLASAYWNRGISLNLWRTLTEKLRKRE